MESCFRQCMHIKVDCTRTAMMYDVGTDYWGGCHLIIFFNQLPQRFLLFFYQNHITYTMLDSRQ